MKVLLIGCSGLLGKKLHSTLFENGFDVYASFHQNSISDKNCFPLDITQKDDVENVIKKIHPDVVVHAAAYSNVDDCETNKHAAFEINVQGTKNIAHVTEQINAKLVYISTDYVFDGKKGSYKEEDPTNPINYYGQTKLEGEDAVKSICSQYIICRTSVIYGANKSNFATWVIDQLKNGKTINIVTDQFVSPTLNSDLSEQIIALINNDVQGIFHTAGFERISRYDFCQIVADVFNLDGRLIHPISMNEMKWIAKRPVDSSLDVSKIAQIKKPYIVKKALKMLQDDIGR